MREQNDRNDRRPEAEEKWAAMLAGVTMPRRPHPVGGPQVDTPVADTQRTYQALDQDERKEFLIWLIRGAAEVW